MSASPAVLERHNAQLQANQALLVYQLFRFGTLVFWLIPIGLVELVLPNFFNYPYFYWSVALSDLAQFWPLALYALILNVGLTGRARSSRMDEELLGWDIATSVLAGLWEELGFRWLFICTAMIGIAIVNWIYSTILGLVFGIGLLAFGFSLFNSRKFVGGVVAMLLAGIAFFFLVQTDPLYWFYNSIMIPFLGLASFGLLGSVFFSGHEPLFVMGAVAANAKFRDGHKYQGHIGTLNSWIVGFVLLYATLAYGLLTAIVIHVLYDVEIGLLVYGMRKLNAR